MPRATVNDDPHAGSIEVEYDTTGSPDDSPLLLLIHGRDDTLIAPSGGVRTAELIPEANLLLLAHMGHDLPEPLWPLLVDAISSHTRAAELASSPAAV